MDDGPMRPTKPYESWSAETRELARELWLTECEQNAADVGRRLGLAKQTVAHWANRDGWADLLADAVQQVAPAIKRRILARYIIAADRGSAYLAEHAAGMHDAPDVSHCLDIENARERSVCVVAAVKAHAEARKQRIVAAYAAGDRVGFSPVGRNDPSSHADMAPKRDGVDARDLRGLSSDELMRIELDIRSRSGR